MELVLRKLALNMKTLLTFLLLLSALTVNAAWRENGFTTNVSGAMINARGSVISNGVYYGNGGGLTNLNLPITRTINTATGNVFYVLTATDTTLIKTNATFALYTIGNGTTNTIVGDNTWVDVKYVGTNWFLRW